MSDDSLNLSEWIAHALVETGVTVVYGGHGGALVPMVNAVCKHPKLKWVCARNEHDAAEMAAAHAKMTGNLGVVIATSGPGATNLATGLLEAIYDKVPLLAITGMKPTAQIGYAEFQDCNQSRLFAGAGVEWSKDAASRDAVIPLLRDAIATAITYQTCAHLAIPVDIQSATSPLSLKPFCAAHPSDRVRPLHEHKSVIEETAQTLVGDPADIPRIIIAVGLRACFQRGECGAKENGEAIMELAEALNAPVLTRLDAKGVVDERHPLSFGVVGVHGKPGMEMAAKLISTSDLVISIGANDETILACNIAGLQIRKVVEIDTDAFGVSTRFLAEHTLVGPIAEICKSLALAVETKTVIRNRKKKVEEIRSFMEDIDEEALLHEKFGYMTMNNPNAIVPEMEEGQNGNGHRRFSSMANVQELANDANRLWSAFHSGDWTKINEVHDGNTKYQADLTASRAGYCHPAAVMAAISRARRNKVTDPVSRNAAICVDVGDVTLWASLSLCLDQGSRTLYSERLGTMGYALCAGVAATCCSSEPAAAIVLAGDGGFQMTLQELATFQQHKKPGDKLICFVFDNEVLGRVAFGFDDAEGCGISGPDYVALAKAFGGDGVKLDKTEDCADVVAKAMAAEGLFVVHVWVDPTVKADMATFKDNSLKVMNSG